MFKEASEKIKKMSPVDFRKLLLRLKIVDAKGKLTKKYRMGD